MVFCIIIIILLGVSDLQKGTTEKNQLNKQMMEM